MLGFGGWGLGFRDEGVGLGVKSAGTTKPRDRPESLAGVLRKCNYQYLD